MPRPKRPAKSGHRFYVQSTIRGPGNRSLPGQGLEVRNEEEAVKMAERIAPRSYGVVAYEIELDAEGEPIMEPRILASHGHVPGLPAGHTVDEMAEA